MYMRTCKHCGFNFGNKNTHKEVETTEQIHFVRCRISHSEILIQTAWDQRPVLWISILILHIYFSSRGTVVLLAHCHSYLLIRAVSKGQCTSIHFRWQWISSSCSPDPPKQPSSSQCNSEYRSGGLNFSLQVVIFSVLTKWVCSVMV